jgi:anthranilate phosphoribosyltransferase
MDEISTVAPTRIFRVVDGEVTEAEFTPEDFGVDRAKPGDVLGGSVKDNIDITKSVLAGDHGPKRDIALVNAAPAIVLGGKASGFVDAMDVAAQSVDSGAAQRVLDESLRLSQQLG